MGPDWAPRAEKTCVPGASGGGAAPARLAPHRAQNWSSARTGLPHESQVRWVEGSGCTSLFIRPPHCGQNGRPLCTAAPQSGHPMPRTGGPAVADTRVAGTPRAAGVESRGPPGFKIEATSMTRAPPLTTGFPQSMQKRESPSLSRPQKPQRFTPDPREIEPVREARV